MRGHDGVDEEGEKTRVRVRWVGSILWVERDDDDEEDMRI